MMMCFKCQWYHDTYVKVPEGYWMPGNCNGIVLHAYTHRKYPTAKLGHTYSFATVAV